MQRVTLNELHHVPSIVLMGAALHVWTFVTAAKGRLRDGVPQVGIPFFVLQLLPHRSHVLLLSSHLDVIHNIRTEIILVHDERTYIPNSEFFPKAIRLSE